MSRQIGLYRKVADDYDRMALLVNDRRLGTCFSGLRSSGVKRLSRPTLWVCWINRSHGRN